MRFEGLRNINFAGRRHRRPPLIFGLTMNEVNTETVVKILRTHPPQIDKELVGENKQEEDHFNIVAIGNKLTVDDRGDNDGHVSAASTHQHQHGRLEKQ